MSHPAPPPSTGTPTTGPATAADTKAAAEVDHDHGRRWWTLATLGLAQLMVVLDATIVNIALPSAQAGLGFSDADRQWVVTAYSLAFGGLLLLGGRLADLFGRRRTLMVGLAGFALASALGGAATGFGTLVAARALQGAFGALLAPAALSLLTITFSDPKERGKAFGIFGAIAGAGAAIGLLLGGVLTEYLSWRWCLYVNVPIAVVAGLGALRFIRKVAPAQGVKLDIPGVITAVLGLSGLVYAFARAENEGWSDPVTITLIVVSVLLLVAFVLIQQRVAHPLLPLRVVLDRRRGGAYLAIGLAAIGMFAVFLFLTYFLQQTKGFTPLRSGFAFLPFVAGIITSSTVVVPRLLPRIGPRFLITTGQLLGAVGLTYLWRLEADSGYLPHVLPALFVMGLGMGLIFASCFNTATSGTQPADAGVASALVNTGQQVGGALGTALLNTIAATVTASYVRANGQTPAALADAAVAGETRAFLVSAGVFLLGAVLSLLVIPSGPNPVSSRGPQAPAGH
ncbi:MFS transporter [Modestobacter muralis]|uniref:MFS transporter n=1 Tax=Modestobacter muralis TaxID=1608614 RepID=A0A6P0HBB2_9ACTN|nr:MFS transporter [Modestobacter muralis]NEN51254.1 MFS transporter [Modestobacter muralis]